VRLVFEVVDGAVQSLGFAMELISATLGLFKLGLEAGHDVVHVVELALDRRARRCSASRPGTRHIFLTSLQSDAKSDDGGPPTQAFDIGVIWRNAKNDAARPPTQPLHTGVI
jgi:hypothetical protein